jgi:hypothetical protein
MTWEVASEAFLTSNLSLSTPFFKTFRGSLLLGDRHPSTAL